MQAARLQYGSLPTVPLVGLYIIMAKELPYFQFEPAEYLTKDVSFCSLSAQGLFIILCSYYWQRQCKLTKDQFLRRFNNIKEFEELHSEGIFDIKDGGFIAIKFLDRQLDNATLRSRTNSANGKKGGAKKGNQNAKKTTEKQPKNNRNSTQKQGIREDKRREEEKREENIRDIKSQFLNLSEQLFEDKARQNKTQIKNVKSEAERFWTNNYEIDLEGKNLNQIKQHFANWIDKQQLPKDLTKKLY